MLKIENISRCYEGSGKRFNEHTGVLDNISLEINDGEFVSIVGPSGCGKSTLINIIAGLSKPSSGAVYYNGKPITKPCKEFAMVFQESSLFPWLNVMENMTFGLKVKGVPEKEAIEKSLYYLDMVNLSQFKDYRIHQLSGGMRQRISIARALALESEVLLMDEPFVAVDTQTRSILHEEVLKIWQLTKKTILFITHDVEEAVLLSNRVVVLGFSPDNIKETVNISIPYPRTVNDDVIEHVNTIKGIINRCSNAKK
ncbi:MAG: ABC transporter ATP-binding protein [Ruminococcaceae bacterium]|nr:ABC transporter ATP-binding protein [Oscillospiraceae bacterium]